MFSRWCLVVCLLVAGETASAELPLHERIDALVAASIKGPVAAASSDAEFVRRVWLDLTGSIPTAEQARSFLNDHSPDKRTKLIDRLLAGSEFPRRMQQVFTIMLLERRSGSTVPMPEWEAWLESSFAADKPLDQLFREMLAADGTDPATRPAMKFFLSRSATDHRMLAGDVSRLLLGRNLDCARCHDHPTIDGYRQADFFGLVAFLNRSYLYKDQKTGESFFLEKGADRSIEFTSVFTSVTANTGPRIPGGNVLEVPQPGEGEDLLPAEEGRPPLPRFPLRPVLAGHLATAENRAFVENLANRLWAMMLGRGLVSPLDMHHAGNPASHPELLDLLADELIRMQFDTQRFLREIALSETYQRSSRIGDGAGSVKPESLAAFPMKPLSAEQLAFSVLRATGSEQRVLATAADLEATKKYRPDKGRPIPAENLDNVLKLFRSIYAAQPGEPEDEFVPSIAAALFVENEPLVLKWLSSEEGGLTARLRQLSSADEIAEELYLTVLTRRPDAAERAVVAEYLNSAGAGRDELLAEMAWALIASSEFRFNH